MLKGKCAVITGASRGIGKAIARKLSELGAYIVINYRKDEEEALKLLNEIKSFGGTGIIIKADISKYDEAEILINKAKEAFGSVDILINNAGITRDNLMLRMKEEDFDRVIDINLKGTFNCIKHAIPLMIKQKYGKIINISSVVGIAGNAGQANYAASKAGIIGLTKSLAKELGGRGINVNAVAPGFIQTDMTEVLSDKIKEQLKSSIPLRRLGNAEDVAELVAFLSDKSSDYITGQVINVDGGMVM